VQARDGPDLLTCAARYGHGHGFPCSFACTTKETTTAALVASHISSSHDSEAPAPGCWDGFGTQKHTLKPPTWFGQRQLSTGHGAFGRGRNSTVAMAPVCTADIYRWGAFPLGDRRCCVQSVHAATGPPTSQIISPRSRCSSHPARTPRSNYHATALPVQVDRCTGNEFSGKCSSSPSGKPTGIVSSRADCCIGRPSLSVGKS
jgi:hypothetical protein